MQTCENPRIPSSAAMEPPARTGRIVHPRAPSEHEEAMKTASERAPVLVGVAAVQQREDDPARAREPLALMGDALERAAEDAGSRALLARADVIRVPRGFWD